MSDDTETATGVRCTGAHDCIAVRHIHGCFADYGACESPAEHSWDAARGFYLINRETYRLSRVRAAWDAVKLAWRCRNV